MTKDGSQDADTSDNLEQTLAHLSRLVERMESGDCSLEESLKDFEQGITLTRNAQKILTDAEQKLQVLVAEDDQSEAQLNTLDAPPASD
jgi:exodeoxyribonuclease VII small subunit